MTEEEALDRVNEIGTAFANDYHDGDGPDFEGVSVTSDGFGAQTLTYTGAYVSEDDEDQEFEFVWRLELISGPG